MDREQLRETLRRVFGHDEFRNQQEQLVTKAINGTNIYCCMPTGSGKSITFLYETQFENRLVVVIQPLLALLLDFSGHLEDLKVLLLVLILKNLIIIIIHGKKR